MSIEVLEIHHCALRVPTDQQEREKVRSFYENVLGLQADNSRPDIPTLPGYWMNAGDVGQVHLMAVSGLSKLAPAPGKDPTTPHIAFAVANIVAAKAELDRLGVAYWTVGVLTGPGAEQIFLDDGSGNLLELHQIDSCRCALKSRIS